MSGEESGYLIQQLFLQKGVLDAYYTQILMKKNRPGILLTVLVRSELKDKISEFLLINSSSFGVRLYKVERTILKRHFTEYLSPWGKIKLKVGILKDKILKITPEYDDVSKIAEENGKTFSDVFNSAVGYAQNLKQSLNKDEGESWRNKQH